MKYEQPKPSAGLVIAGLLGLVAAYVLRWIPSTGDTDLGLMVLLLFLAGITLLLLGVWRLVNAIDAAALHRWRSVTEAATKEADTLPSGRGGDRVGVASTHPEPIADPEPGT